MSQTTTDDRPRPSEKGGATTQLAHDPQADAQGVKATLSTPGGFKNDPDDARNPNEEIERHRDKLRP